MPESDAAAPDQATAFWSACMKELGNELSSQVLSTWFAPIKPLDLELGNDPSVLLIGMPSQFYVDWIRDHYKPLLARTARKVAGHEIALRYEITGETQQGGGEMSGEPLAGGADVPARPTDRPPTRREHAERNAPAKSASAPRTNAPPTNGDGLLKTDWLGEIGLDVEDTQLSPEYTFDRFIQGDCNQLAFSAATAIAAQPERSSYNPFLVYGGVGLGKTHLVQAVGHEVKRQWADKRVLYTSSEAFTSQFVQAIQNNHVAAFSAFYRQVDVLIVDDVQFFGGKEKTQEEFFHVFNSLHQAGKQIVLCADRAPKDIPGIEERLLSRFRWGLTADVQPPDLETRIAILQQRAEDAGIDGVPPDVIDFIAERITSNIRSLEGALNRLVAHSQLRNEAISVQSAKRILDDVIDSAPKRLEISDIQASVAQYYSLDPSLLSDKTRKKKIVLARQVAMYLAKQFTDATYKDIGLRFGGRDHSTVIHACRKIEDMLETEASFQNELEEAERLVQQTS